MRRESLKAVFSITLLLCILLNFFFLKIVLKNGLTGDDWQLLFAYKTFDPEPLSRFLDTWLIRGPYTTVQFYYIGLLERVFGLDYLTYQIINIFFKIFASLTVFLLISKIFKDYFMAGMSAVIFSIIHSSSGALQYVVKGTEYLAIGFMNIFFLCYNMQLTKNSFIYKLLTPLVLIISFMLSPIRIYPLFALIIFFEAFILYKKKQGLLKSLSRMGFLYLPIVFLTLISKGTTGTYLKELTDFIKVIWIGNWHFFIRLFDGLGYSLLGNDQLKIVGMYTLGSFDSYLFFLIKPLLIFLGITLLLSLAVRRFKKEFIFWSISAAIILFFLLFIFAIKAFTIPDEFRKLYQSDTKIGPISLFGASILAWSFGFFINWFKRGRRLNRDFLLFGGPLFALLFLTATWLILGPPFGFSEAVNRYFSFFLSIGTGANEQIYMQNQVLNSLNNDKENVLVYFEGLHEDPKLFQYHEVSSNLGYFNYWMLYFKNPSVNGCIAYIADKNELKKAYRVIYQDEYFENDALCAKSRYKIDTAKTTFKIEDFRAFQFRDKRILNITDQMLQKIRLNNI